MMTATAFGKPLNTLRDGVVATSQGANRPLPLIGTTIDIDVRSGLAITNLSRRFRNDETDPIEVLMTFPVGFHSAVTGLAAVVGGRHLVGRAQAKERARDFYEAALDRGELAVLHEEPLRGLNVVSIAPLPPGAEVEVCAEIVTPLSATDEGSLLRLPMTIGDVYGDSPLLPADDVLTQRGLVARATLCLRGDAGTARIADGRLVTAAGLNVDLAAAIEITIEGGQFGEISGWAAGGERVDLRLSRRSSASPPLSCAILFDRSGSTAGGFSDAPHTVWEAMREGLAAAFSDLSEADEIALWQFDDEPILVGTARGPQASRALLAQLGGPNGGTELIGAVSAAAQAGAKQILVLTDGQTWATQPPDGLDACVNVILVGSESLDAGIGHVAAQTGGEVFYAAGRATVTAIAAGLSAMRAGSSRASGQLAKGMPQELACARSGVNIVANWSASDAEGDRRSDPVGRFAASLALPLFTDEEEATKFAAAHDLACHLTSLALVDPLTTSNADLPRTIRQPLALASTQQAFVSYSAAPCAAEFAQAAHIRRMPSLDGLPHLGRGPLSEPASGRKSLLDRLLGRRASQADAKTIDWALHAPDFVRNDLSSIPADLLATLQDWADDGPVRKLSDEMKQPALLIALALYAQTKASTDRNARRFAKKVLTGIPSARIREIHALVGIS